MPIPDPFMIFLAVGALWWALRRGLAALAAALRGWWRQLTGGGERSRSWRVARAGTRGLVTVGALAGAGAAAGWREGWTRVADFRDARRSAAAARQAWLRAPARRRTAQGLIDAGDPLWWRGRFHARRGDQQALAQQPAIYRRGVAEGERDRRVAQLDTQQLTLLGFRDGLRDAPQVHPTRPEYRHGWQQGQRALNDQDPPPRRPARQAPPTEGDAMSSTAPAAGPVPMPTAVGASPEVTDVTSALTFARAVRAGAATEVEEAQSAVRAATARIDDAQAELHRANGKLRAFSIFHGSLSGLEFGRALLGPVAEMLQATTTQRDAAAREVEAAQLALSAARARLAAAEQLHANAEAVVRGLLTHTNVQEVAAGATGGMALRDAYGPRARQGRSS